IGFVMGSQAIISIATAESGIILSLALLAVGLWTKSNKIVPVLAVLLASCHGAAHGVELGQSDHVTLLMLGMLSAMSLIYITGLALATFIHKYVPYGKQIVAAITTVVAVICIA
ncbi:MAG: HupE/UreJ family protein, partial [Paracoccus sp. (in: a-proteobacteria)]